MLKLNYRDSRPIYEQIKDGVRDLLIAGGLVPGEKLPSVREMATSLAINPNTIQRAYRELEAEGYIYSIPGKGSFAGDKIDAREKRKLELYAQFDKVVKELLAMGIEKASLISRVEESE